jgi:hypothetical protein
MNNIKIYTTTKGNKEDCILYKCLQSYGMFGSAEYSEILGVSVHYEDKNTKSLQQCYNNFIDDARKNNIDIAVMVHDDVHINTRDLYSLISKAADQYAVFGLAGATSCKVGSPALWHLMSKREDQRGCVAHGDKDSYMYTSFGPVPSRCLVIDGVFIGINIKKLPESVRFDESYPSKFHYYDLDFSLECNRNHVTIGVVDIPIIHNSPGLTKPDKEFYDGQAYFIKKWQK